MKPVIRIGPAVAVMLVVGCLVAAVAAIVSSNLEKDVLLWQLGVQSVVSLLSGSMALVGVVLLLAVALSKAKGKSEAVVAPLVLVLAAGFLHYQSWAAAIGAAIVVLGIIVVKAINAHNEVEVGEEN
jgi:hypothetical protein